MLAKRTKRTATLLFTAFIFCTSGTSYAEKIDFSKDFDRLYNASCISCHSNSDLTPLNLKTLSRDLADGRAFQTWIRIYDRVTKGEMPPRDGPKASDEIVETAMNSLKQALMKKSIASRGEGRTPLRRLTQTEYALSLIHI